MQQKASVTVTNAPGDPQSMLTIRLLGTVEVLIDPHFPIELGSRKAQALFVYLVRAAKPIARDTLTALLWPEMAEQVAKNNFRTTLTRLKHHLGPYLDITTTSVAFNRRAPYVLDVEALYDSLDEATSTQDPVKIQAAVELYRGEFLQGFHVRGAEPFEEWMLQQREQLHLQIVHALETLMALCIERNELTLGLDAGRRLLTMEPWSEVTHRQMMILWIAGGQRGRALQQYETCRQVLANELDVEPSAETIALYQQIQQETDQKDLAYRQAGQPTKRIISPSTVKPTAVAVLPPKGTPANQPSMPHNLARPLTAFIGRQAEMDFLYQHLCRSDCRFLTIVGPGGMGKSSLALEFGLRLLQSHRVDFPDGIFWVPLATIGVNDREGAVIDDAATAEAVLRTIAEQLSTQSLVNLSSTAQLHAYLQSRCLLLILDNFEHLLAGSHALSALLTQAPKVKVLVTSRARLKVRGERMLPLDKLSLPANGRQRDVKAAKTTSPDVLLGALQGESEAVAMFVQRARQIISGFAIDAETIDPVIEICQLVEGLPLGIELATSMLPLLSCDELAAELAIDLDFLESDTYDLPSDQRTLAAVFERSWRLLSPEAQQLLARLSIFPGSFQRDAAEAIVGASSPLLNQLLDQSLVSRFENNRYILHRTIHAFAGQKLRQWPEQDVTLRIHYANFYLTFLAAQELALTGAAYTKAKEEIQIELNNIHTAWHRAVDHNMYSALKNCLSALYFFYEQYGFYLDAFSLYEQALSHLELLDKTGEGDTESSATRNLLIGLLQTYFAWINLRTARLQQVDAIYEASWSRLAQAEAPGAAAICLGYWGTWKKGGDLNESAALLTESLRLARISRIKWLEVLVLQTLGECSYLLGEYDRAEEHIHAGSALARQMGWSRAIASGHKIMARVNILRGQYHRAEETLHEALTLVHQHRFDVFYVECTLILSEALRLQGQFTAANACYVECRQKAMEWGIDQMFTAPILWEEGTLAEERGEYEKAKTYFTESLTLGLPNWWAHALPTLGWALIGLNEKTEAHSYFQEIHISAKSRGLLPVSLDAQAGLTCLETLQSKAEPRSRARQQSFSILRTIYHHPAVTQKTRDRVVEIAAELDDTLTLY